MVGWKVPDSSYLRLPNFLYETNRLVWGGSSTEVSRTPRTTLLGPRRKIDTSDSRPSPLPFPIVSVVFLRRGGSLVGLRSAHKGRGGVPPTDVTDARTERPSVRDDPEVSVRVGGRGRPSSSLRLDSRGSLPSFPSLRPRVRWRRQTETRLIPILIT